MSRKKRRKHKGEQPPEAGAEAPPEGASAPGEDDAVPDAAPTQYRRNVWLLIVIVLGVLAAWLANLFASLSAPAQ